jgi:hypothetical protein
MTARTQGTLRMTTSARPRMSGALRRGGNAQAQDRCPGADAGRRPVQGAIPVPGLEAGADDHRGGQDDVSACAQHPCRGNWSATVMGVANEAGHRGAHGRDGRSGRQVTENPPQGGRGLRLDVAVTGAISPTLRVSPLSGSLASPWTTPVRVSPSTMMMNRLNHSIRASVMVSAAPSAGLAVRIIAANPPSGSSGRRRAVAARGQSGARTCCATGRPRGRAARDAGCH